MPLSSGQILQNRYRIVKPIGQGGFGAVYRAWDTALNQPCALKENLDTSAEAQRQFHQEATLLASLRHQHLPRVIDHFFIPGQGQYLVMDFVEGTSLADRLDQQRAPLTEVEVLPWIEQVCQAVDYLHRRTPPIIHRDIKPQNIIITPEGQAMLVDFGISKIYDPQLKTVTGARAISPGFSPIEQYGQGGTDARSDIYALGATLYMLLTGQLPPESLDRLAETVILTPPRRLNPLLNPEVEQVILQALAVKPVDRWQTVKEFQAKLIPPVGVQHPRSYRPGWLITGVGVLALLVFLIGSGVWATLRQTAIGETAISTPAVIDAKTDRQGAETIEPALIDPGKTTLQKVTPSPTPTPVPSPSPTSGSTPAIASDSLNLPVTTAPLSEMFDDPELDRQKWAFIEGDGQISLDGGVMRLTSAGQTFPLVHPRQNPFPSTEDFDLTVRMRYIGVTNRGVGFRVGTSQVTYGANQDQNRTELFAGRMIEIWQDSTNWRLTVGEENKEVYTLPTPQLSWYEIEIVYINNVYRVSIDGAEVYVSPPTTVRPTVLWFGNPAQVNSAGEWSGLEVDQVVFKEVVSPSIAVTPTPIPATTTPAPLEQNCQIMSGQTFAGLWQTYRSSLGCPTDAQTTISTIAEELFQGGHLFWRKDTDAVYVIYDRQKDGNELFEGRWQTNPTWKWDGSSPDGLGLSPPPGLVEPKRGFGWLWRTHLGGVEGPLGWAIDKEYGFDNIGQAQSFDQGVMFKGSASKIYILLNNGIFYAR